MFQVRGPWPLLLTVWLAALPACDSTEPNSQDPAGDNALVDFPPFVEPAAGGPANDVPTVNGDGAVTQALKVNSKEQQRVDQEDDPDGEGWTTEVLQSDAKHQLYALAEILEKSISAHEEGSATEDPDSARLAALDKLITEDFSCQPLRPAPLQEVFADSELSIVRWSPSGEQPKSESPLHKGSADLLKAFRQSLYGLDDVDHPHFAVKVFGIQQEDGFFTTKQYITLTGTTHGNGFEQNSMWLAEWVKTDKDKKPRLRSINVRQFEQAVLLAGKEKIFNECTEAVLQHNPLFEKTLARGVSYWMGRVDNHLGPDIFGHQGIALGDVNGDGIDDVYVCQSGALPNCLFIHDADGKATDIAAEAGVDWADMSSGVLLIDLDNDGDQDLVLCTRIQPSTVIMSNDGQGHFELVKEFRDADYLNPTAADYDNDGDLDLYLCAQNTKGGDRFPSPMPIHDANNGGRNALLRNDGDFQFTDVTKEVGLDVNNRRYSFAASWADIDNDGDLDIYVANDWGRNNLYRNDGGKFMDVTEASGAEDGNFGMSVSFGDPNRDGLLDIYIANMYSSAGNRVMSQNRFKPGIDSKTRSRFMRLARGNTLLLNQGGSQFQDVSEDAGVTLGRWAWGSNFIDLNNDGWEDLVVANGYVSNPQDSGDL